MSLRSALWWPLLEPQPPPRCLPTSHASPGGHAPLVPRGWSRPGSTAAAAAACPTRARGPALTSLSICLPTEDFEGENPQVPKLEKSVSGTSPKREHLPLAAGIAFFLMTLLAS